MKRVGHLFERAFSPEALYQAWLDASKGKMARRATLAFSRRLGANLQELHEEIHAGTYRPQTYVEFQVFEPKQRTIYAPAFRDLVVQHAIYRLIYPLFNAGLIDQSFACRVGMGTHRAADYAQAALRAAPAGTCTLKLDIRRFFYRIDRARLRAMLERRIKDTRFVDMMMTFAQYGHPRTEPLGIPIGNLLSQLYALIYLSPLDHFIKRELKAQRYARYVDDFVIFGWTRERCLQALQRIQHFLRDTLALELSRWTLAPISRGLNFVGYRTWRSRRFIRRHSLHRATRCARKGQLASVVSILGHARATASWLPLVSRLKEISHALFDCLPQAHHRPQHLRAAAA
jgi:retron-type reverse transcriptase